uniref:Integrase, catalytic region, zinc finger, CCHC-type, peptidase aspartic, catalytic n=1 Tax=Tanacetum cinerariifolium TaxID=118510 RepID=A0A6L2J296_TANCI|nr:hypothetical protein [Tanacetum cinerariifolium]
MSTTSDDIQAASSDTCSPMLDRTDYESWAQHFRLYCKNKRSCSDSADMGNSNIIPYEQYVKHNEGLVIPSGESSVPNDAYGMHENSAYVLDDSFTATLNMYKDQVAIYEQRAKFELTDSEQKMDDQMLKEMKEIFKSMEAEVDQNTIDLKSGEIERKNLLITNDNLIAKCIAQDVFYTVTNSALTASQFHKLSIAYNVAKTRAVELEAEILNLHKKIQNNDHDNMVKHLSRLEVDNLNLQLKYQHLKDRTETSKSMTSKDALEFDAFFKLNEKDAQLQTHRNTIRKLKDQISQFKANKSDVTGTLLPQPLES